MRRLAIGLLLQGLYASCAGGAAPARAEAPVADGARTDPQLLLSDRLFSEAKQAEKAGDLARACDGFDRSLSLVPRSGTSLNLGLCREQQRRLVEARTALRTTLHLLEVTGGRQDRAPIARAHLRDVEAALSWIDVTPAPGIDVTRIAVRLDGVLADPTQGPIPVDAGKHLVSITVDRFPPRTVDVSVGDVPEHRVVYVSSPDSVRDTVGGAPPSLPASLLSARAPEPHPQDEDVGPRRSHLWWWLGASGLIVAAGVTVLLVARSNPRYPSSDVHVTYP